MSAATRTLGQAAFWVALAVAVGLFAQWPVITPLPPGHGELKLSMAHLTERVQPCRQLDAEERAKLPPNMRAFEVCERERAPAHIELRLDGRPLLAEAVRPTGLHRDGRAYLHRVWALPAGRYALELRLRDSPRAEGFDHQRRFLLDLDTGRSALLTVGDGEARLQPAAASADAG